MTGTAAQQLRAELVRAAVARHRRRRVRARACRGAAAVALVAGLAGAAVRAGGSRPAGAEALVAVRRGQVLLTLVDLEHDPATIEAALARAGVRAHVVAVPVGPSLVGRFVSQARLGSGPGVEPLEPGAARCGSAQLSVPVGWPGELELRVGRPAAGDEPYAAFVDALAEGEPLAGEPVRGRSVDEAALTLADRTLSIEVELVDGAATAVLPLPEAVRGDHGAWVVAGAVATDRRRVVLRAVPPGQPLRGTDAC